MSEVTPWPVATSHALDAPKPIRRPCDAGLDRAWMDLEMQLGTVEGYNRLVRFAEAIRTQIDEGRIKAQNPIYARHVRGATPAEGRLRAGASDGGRDDGA